MLNNRGMELNEVLLPPPKQAPHLGRLQGVQLRNSNVCEDIHIHTYIKDNMYIYIYIYMHMLLIYNPGPAPYASHTLERPK